MKEVYLLRKKSDTTEAVHTYNMCVAAAGGYRIETIRCDKGGENTGSEFRDYCKNSAIKLEYAATNTPQQIGVSERDGQTLAGVTPVSSEGWRFSAVHVGGVNADCSIPVEQVPTLSTGRSYAILEVAQ